MYIAEIIVEGFKSYAHRTVIGKFDPLFNAITGLNGSGKSNILDSICFVLGISQLSQVRVGSLQELVFKKGQAGITKASVTIVFNNEDKKTSPVGYDEFNSISVTRQVVIGGRNKYLINGSLAQAGKVLNFFQSVQLNVNNPHFLIMQGRITKVMNMKPLEILGMIEEAAGTRMYETKKKATLCTIEKKERKVEEIIKILQDEISPTLEKLRTERDEFLAYTGNQTVVDKLERVVLAHGYAQSLEVLKSSEKAEKEVAERIAQLQETISSHEKQIREKKSKIASLTDKRDKEHNSLLKNLEKESGSASELVVKANVALSHKQEALQAAKKAYQSTLEEIAALTRALTTKTREHKIADELLKGADATTAGLVETLRIVEAQYETKSIGVSVGSNAKSTSTADPLMDARKAVTEATTEVKQLEMEENHLQQQLREKKRNNEKPAQEEIARYNKQIDRLKAELEDLKQRQLSVGFDQEKLDELVKNHTNLQRRAAELKDKKDHPPPYLSRLQFLYSNPTPSFDHGKVKGLVAKLIDVPDPSTTTAVETVAGGRLYNVVVDSEKTSSELIKNGRLQDRYTFIPLSQIRASRLPDRVVSAAESVAGRDNVRLALFLVRYSSEVQKAMEYVFGGAFICKDDPSASKVAFSPSTAARAVTLGGDVYDPRGTLTGGSQQSAHSVLKAMCELNTVNEEYEAVTGNLKDVSIQITGIQEAGRQTRSVKTALDLKQHELEILTAQLSSSPAAQVIKEIEELQQRVVLKQEAIAQAKERLANATRRCQELQGQEGTQSTGSSRDAELKRLEEQIRQAKAAVKKDANQRKEKKQTAEKLRLEKEGLEKELDIQQNQQLKQLEEQVRVSAAELKDVEETYAEAKVKRDQAKEAEEARKKEIESQSHKITKLNQECDELFSRKSEAEIDLKKHEHSREKCSKAKEQASKYIREKEKSHPWINSDKHKFGQKGDYDFSHIEDDKRKLKEKKAEQEELFKRLNRKVMTMYESTEEKYHDLVKKREKLEKDKKSIETTIANLDLKKKQTLQATFKKVDKDFTSIFSSLLPGSTAKLEKVGDTIFEGLEVKVAFRNVWKSLTELSGGQRSLLALSLILALLLYKPAPMYILDEVDAALDPSHTQNIGSMLKTHFGHSQFIVVSLKKGMYNNANVVFEAKCIDGVSTVSRRTNKDVVATGADSDDEDAQPHGPTSKRPRKGGRT
ncbi:structural maintenance of chromosomes protein 2 [Pelomyxa schiedti]|nr:structural maintenance of chromosomes protein 2 [Pelomyxa schiedti]